MPWSVGDPKPLKNSGNPFKDVDVKCNWCDEKMKGKNYPKHCGRKKHEYLSYKVLNVGFFDFFRGKSQPQDGVKNENAKEPKETVIFDDPLPPPAVQETKTKVVSSVISRKRKWQPTLFESSWSKMQQFETMIGDLLYEVDDPQSQNYLQRLRQTLKEIDKAAIEIRAYRDKKRQKYEELMRLEETMMKLSKHNTDLKEQIRAKDARYLATKEAGVYSNDIRVIAQEDIDRVVQHRQQVVNTLRAHLCFDISTDGKEVICRFCANNWEKAKLNFSEKRGKIKISGAIGAHAKRHVLMANHTLCRRAEDSFQIHRNYYEEIYSSTEKRIACMTDNVIRVIYFIIKENIAMRKSERMFDLLDQCETPIGNQLHSRKTGAAIAMCIDETLQKMLIQWMFGKLAHSPKDIFVIADELTDVSGTKSCIVKTRTFEGMMLVEHLLTMVQSNGTSEDLAKKMQNSIIGDITRYVGRRTASE